MEIFAKLESWDYLALALLLVSLWLLLSGIKKLQAADPEHVDTQKLQIRAGGALLAAAAYLACRYFA